MRLINADDLPIASIDITDLPVDRGLLVYYAEDVDNAPTINAIPINVINAIKDELIENYSTTGWVEDKLDNVLGIIDKVVKIYGGDTE